jgi:hypothetical protein
MVLHRPVECTALIGQVGTGTGSENTALSSAVNREADLRGWARLFPRADASLHGWVFSAQSELRALELDPEGNRFRAIRVVFAPREKGSFSAG